MQRFSPVSERAGGWHSRGYLPHFDRPGSIQMVTFRLADSIPAAKLIEFTETRVADSARRQHIEDWLDAGYGACYLKDQRVACSVESALLHFDGIRYQLLAWVVMGNHVHVVVETLGEHELSDVVHSWKSFTSNEANRLLVRRGRFWQPEYFDRLIRDERHLEAAIRYTEGNPVKAGLVESPGDWPFSSVRFRTE